jgi:putative ABC transport system permease protein
LETYSTCIEGQCLKDKRKACPYINGENMHLNDAFHSALQSIYNHKLRSFLTLTGIVIGVLAVVTMFSSVYALKTVVKSNMEGMGWNDSIIITNSQEEANDRTRTRVTFRRTPENAPLLNYNDFLALRSALAYKVIYGMIESQSLYRIKNKDIQVTLRGTNRDYFINKTYNLKSGRYFNRFEEENGSPVIVLGYYFAQEQFGTSDPVGKMITISGHRYLVVGVLDTDKLNNKSGMDFGGWERKNDLKAVYVPLKFASIYLVPNRIVHYIYIQSKDDATFAPLKTQVRQMLLARHSMYPNFAFQDVGAILLQVTEEIDKNMKKWNITLFAIASISLIVGGIGLFSTLLISIQEKMLEIGVRKSIGATESDIFFYFIFEAIVLAILGALIGIMLASLALMGMQAAIKIPMPMPYQGMALGLVFSILIGFVSGLYPAIKASGIDPIKAIYYFD